MKKYLDVEFFQSGFRDKAGRTTVNGEKSRYIHPNSKRINWLLEIAWMKQHKKMKTKNTDKLN